MDHLFLSVKLHDPVLQNLGSPRIFLMMNCHYLATSYFVSTETVMGGGGGGGGGGG